MTDATRPVTPLDKAHAAMTTVETNDVLRLRFYEKLADEELILLLEEEASGDAISPEVIHADTAAGSAPFALAFDTEDRLAAYAGAAAPYGALPGRIVAAMLAEAGIGLALNLGVAPSSILIPAEALGWLGETLGTGPEQVEETITAISRPAEVPERLLAALDNKLELSMGLAARAVLVEAEYSGGRHGWVLAFIGAGPRAQDALARTAHEAVAFSGLDEGALDVTFLDDGAEMTARVDQIGYAYDMRAPEPEAPTGPKAPGSDPSKPPILKF